MTNETLDQEPSHPNPADSLPQAELASALRREWARLGEHADELESIAEAVQAVTNKGQAASRRGARHQAAALAAAATRAAVVLGDLQRVAGRIEAYADALEHLAASEVDSHVS